MERTKNSKTKNRKTERKINEIKKENEREIKYGFCGFPTREREKKNACQF